MRQGFSLIEYVIYIGIVAIVLTSSLSFAWMMINDQVKLDAEIDVNTTGALVIEKLGYYIERVDNIDSLTLYGVDSGRIVLNYATNPQITIDTYQKQITMGNATLTITKLRFKEGASAAVDLTSDDVDVEDFILTDLSKANSTTVGIELRLEAVNPSKSRAHDSTETWTNSVTLRKF